MRCRIRMVSHPIWHVGDADWGPSLHSENGANVDYPSKLLTLEVGPRAWGGQWILRLGPHTRSSWIRPAPLQLWESTVKWYHPETAIDYHFLRSVLLQEDYQEYAVFPYPLWIQEGHWSCSLWWTAISVRKVRVRWWVDRRWVPTMFHHRNDPVEWPEEQNIAADTPRSYNRYANQIETLSPSGLGAHGFGSLTERA